MILIDHTSGVAFHLREGSNLIGRSSECNIKVSPNNHVGLGVSRSHAEVSVHDGIAFLRDLGSRNGTFIHGDRLQPDLAVQLNHGDEFSVYFRRFTFMEYAPAEMTQVVA